MAEFEHDSPTEADRLHRRRFLQVMGASFAALGIPACSRGPEERAVAYLKQPEEITPGVASWYASTCAGCSAACGVLVKSREGRPIKVEGSPEHPLSHGGVCARGQATVLDLYDSQRLKGPRAGGRDASWKDIDAEVRAKLAEIGRKGGRVRILSRTVTSPSMELAIARFLETQPGARHVVYDPLSASAILDAHALTHGERRLPWYRFERAKVIVGFDADFLGTWISPVEFSKAWSLNRDPGEERDFLSWHAQFEAMLTVTGANADLRVPLRPSQQAAAVVALGRMVAERLERPAAFPETAPEGVDPALLERVADRLASHRGRSLVVSGSSDVRVQVAVNALNFLLGNYDGTLDLAQPSLQLQGDDAAFDALVAEMARGDVAALILLDANPCYDHPRAREFAAALDKVGLTVSLSGRPDETASAVRYVCPDHHPLESWGDAHPHVGVYSLFQPLIAPLYGTRAAVETILAWAGVEMSAYDWVRSVWKERIFPGQGRHASFDRFWQACVHDGVHVAHGERLAVPPFQEKGLARMRAGAAAVPDGAFELVAYPSVALGDGSQANNPWLQELPDPITKATWGNYVSLSPASARGLGVVEGRVVEVRGDGRKLRLPVQVQPGMPDGVAAVALGYGRTHAGDIAANYPLVKMFPIEQEPLRGANAYPFLAIPAVTLHPTGQMDALAKTQRYDRQDIPFNGEHRDIVHETTADEYARDPHAGNGGHAAENDGLWPAHAYTGHRWAMAIDLNRCTGCSACVVSCQAENNVPVVGKAEVRKYRDMHWMRIDRYYNGDADNPDVAIQPMLCQHCENAPCETVCPALATLHSSEGLNMQVYNRCVGTRYCANNCPYKVRRFNWFDYAHADPVQNLVLNPDIAVRTRGIMEKCSFCVQRVAEGKRAARREGRKPIDGEIQPACAQSCPTDAIVFGDINDKASRVARRSEDARSYRVLDHLHVQPSVRYLTKVRNRKS